VVVSNNKAMFKDRSLRIGVVSSVVASLIIIIFVQPLFNFIWPLLQEWRSSLKDSYINSLYTHAAFGERNWIVTELYLYANAFIIPFLFLLNSRLKNRVNKLENRTQEDDGDDHLAEQKFDPGKRIKRLKINIKIQFALIIVLSFFIFHNVFKAYVDIQLNTSFKQRLNAISHKLNVEQEEELISLWARMQTREDYLMINDIIEKTAIINDLELPKELL
jgi:hypothetical protein